VQKPKQQSIETTNLRKTKPDETAASLRLPFVPSTQETHTHTHMHTQLYSPFEKAEQLYAKK